MGNYRTRSLLASIFLAFAINTFKVRARHCGSNPMKSMMLVAESTGLLYSGDVTDVPAEYARVRQVSIYDQIDLYIYFALLAFVRLVTEHYDTL